MPNMSYCRFRDTLNDLRDCEEHIPSSLSDREEHEARRRLVEICRNIVEAADNDDIPSEMGYTCDDCDKHISVEQYRNGGVCSDCGHQRVEDSEMEQSRDGR